MNQRGILSHVQKVLFIPQKSIRWIYVWTKLKCWFVLKHFTPLPFQFIHWTHEEKWHLESFCNLQPLDWPYKIKPFAYRESLHVASVFKFTLLDPTKKIVEHFGILPTPWPYKSIHSTYGSSWHVDSFFWIYLPCPLRNAMFSVWTSMASLLMSKCSLPSPATRQYVEHMERKASWVIFEIYSPSTLQSNTLKKNGESWHVEFFLRWKLARRVILKI